MTADHDLILHMLSVQHVVDGVELAALAAEFAAMLPACCQADMTALHVACRYDFHSAVSLLAHPGAVGKNHVAVMGTPLHIACARQAIVIV